MEKVRPWCGQPSDRGRLKNRNRSTQPCIPPGSLNRVPASAGVKAGMSPLPGWQVILCDPIWNVSSRSGEASRELLYSVYFTLLTTSTDVHCTDGPDCH